MAEEKLVMLVAGSDEEEEILRHAREVLERFAVGHETRRGVEGITGQEAEVYIATVCDGRNLAAELAGRLVRPVLAVPVEGEKLRGLECLQEAMKPGPGAPLTLAVGKAGAINAALMAVAILANGRAGLREALEAFRREQEQKVLADEL